MKRVELLEALYLQGKLMRELQVRYLKINVPVPLGGFPTHECKMVFHALKSVQKEYDRMVKELDKWWKTHEEPVLDSARTDSCEATFGMTADKVKELHDFMVSPKNADPVQIAFLNDGIIVNQTDGDDDIRI